MKDFLNQTIAIGDTVVYPGRRGSSLWMNRATVIDIRVNSIRVQRVDDNVIKTLNRVDRVVVVTEQLSSFRGKG